MTDPAIRFVASPAVPGISETARTAGLLFVSGQVPDPAHRATFADQVDGAFRALDGALARAGSSADRLVRVTIYVTDLPSRDLATLRAVRDRWVDTDRPPASSLVGVAALAEAGIAVEVEAVATAG